MAYSKGQKHQLFHWIKINNQNHNKYKILGQFKVMLKKKILKIVISKKVILLIF